MMHNQVLVFIAWSVLALLVTKAVILAYLVWRFKRETGVHKRISLSKPLFLTNHKTSLSEKEVNNKRPDH